MENLKRKDGSSNKDGINDNTYNLLFKAHDHTYEEEDSYDNLIAFLTIDHFTKSQDKELSQNKLLDTNKITYNNESGKYEYRDHDLIIEFNKISNIIDDEHDIEELTSDKRYGKCHNMSMLVSAAIEDSKVITGYIKIGDQKILHSVVEIEQDGKKMILDWTKNLGIAKEQYYKLTKFIELSSIEGSKVFKDFISPIKKLPISTIPYLLFRDEIIKAMEKNPQIFNQVENNIKTK